MEDIYRGFYIPSGSIIIANIWSITHDKASLVFLPFAFHLELIYVAQSVYPDPYTFNPDRFIKDGLLNTDVKDPSDFVFGFGRRWDISSKD